ncbi:hypothetical protein KM908_20435 [Alkalihalobacillus clausii]|uniref:hypothetical protein n=1 Tax=Shouchella clausii TaxID=79880 RepID=UPI001C2414A9|nr:hypothetical protein [Shouchella clausii]MBU8598483.1 hypothetical protein [Shouchella clausii]
MKRVEFTSRGIVLADADGSYEVHSNDRIQFFNQKGECERVVLMESGYINGLSNDGGKTFISVIDRRELTPMSIENGFEITCAKCGSGDVLFSTGDNGFDAILECNSCGNDYWDNYEEASN